MNDAFCFSLLKIATAQIIQQSTAFERIHGSTCSTVTDVLARYLSLLGSVAKEYSHNANRSKSNALDVLQTLVDLGVDVDDLHQWFEETMEAKSTNAPKTHNTQLTLQNLYSNNCMTDPEDWLVYEYREVPEGLTLSNQEESGSSDIDTEEREDAHLVGAGGSSPNSKEKNSHLNTELDNPDSPTEAHPMEVEPTGFVKSSETKSCSNEADSKRPGEPETATNSTSATRPLYIPSHLPPLPEILSPQGTEEPVDAAQVPEITGAQVAVVSNTKNDSDYNPYTHIIPFNESKIASTSDVSLLSSISQIGDHTEESSSSTPTTPLFDEIFQKALGSVSSPNEMNGSESKPIPYSYLERRRKQKIPGISSTISPYDTLFGNISTHPSTVDQILHQVAAPEVLYQYVSQPVPIFPAPEMSHFKMLNGQSSSMPPQTTEVDSTAPTEAPVVPSTRAREDSIKEPVAKKIIKTSAKENANHTIPESPRPEATRRSSTPKIRLKVSVPTPPPPPAEEPATATAPAPVPETRGQNEEVINCICVNPRLDDGNFMIACDRCQVWFHGSCVGVSEGDIVDTWFCQRCVSKG
ncbi:hypothetical protein K493DRAFT_298313 [Basidiobolus meristosporus CBS 931.73]|uniref:PHD-type domain-containing protein n=1 Tax=Basidiobolus meristosporus CBS 931.73 TaxID=1314790 RepID=A0A1Y1YUW9_9FUNG|nr:hypothetical protein K493DRAFT_298313 [Basidiobolus meristosporus CBS 931.73]|eukprot:ORY01527.1 hypothetical protein K493DRAFT_298313 [Basidiobolus meristosporus CBS 931.73]